MWGLWDLQIALYDGKLSLSFCVFFLATLGSWYGIADSYTKMVEYRRRFFKTALFILCSTHQRQCATFLFPGFERLFDLTEFPEKLNANRVWHRVRTRR